MRAFAMLVLCVLLAGASIAQKKGEKNEEIPFISFCDLLKDRSALIGRTVRTTVLYGFGGEDFAVLYLPSCYENGTLQPVFSDEYEVKTRKKVKSVIDRNKNSGGTVRLDLVGKVYENQIHIEYLERANFLSKSYSVPYEP